MKQWESRSKAALYESIRLCKPAPQNCKFFKIDSTVLSCVLTPLSWPLSNIFGFFSVRRIFFNPSQPLVNPPIIVPGEQKRSSQTVDFLHLLIQFQTRNLPFSISCVTSAPIFPRNCLLNGRSLLVLVLFCKTNQPNQASRPWLNPCPLSLSLRSLGQDWAILLAGHQLYVLRSGVASFIVAIILMAWGHRGISNLAHDAIHRNLAKSNLRSSLSSPVHPRFWQTFPLM